MPKKDGSMTVKEKKMELKKRGVKGFTTMKVDELDAALKKTTPIKTKTTTSKKEVGDNINPNIKGWKIHWTSLAKAKNFLNTDHDIGGDYYEGTRKTYKSGKDRTAQPGMESMGEYWTDFEGELNDMISEEFPGKDLYSRDLMTFLSPFYSRYAKTKDALTAKTPEQVFERFLDYIDEEKLPKKFADIKSGANKGNKKGMKYKTKKSV